MGAVTRARQRRRDAPGQGLRRGPVGRPARSTPFDPSRLTSRRSPARCRTSTPVDVLDRKELRRTDRYIQFAPRGGPRGDGPGRPAGPPRGRRWPSETGRHPRHRAWAASDTLFEQIVHHRRRAARTGSARSSSRWRIANVGAGQVAIAFGPLGPNFATVSRLRHRRPRDRRGVGDRSGAATPTMMLAGGAEAAIHEALVGGFAAMRALSTRNDDPAGASRPFDQGRDGFVIGEGAGVLVLEDARARPGARRASRWPSWSATAPRPTPSTSRSRRPGGVGAVRAARRALEKAGLRADDVDHVNAHATSHAGRRPGRAAGDPDALRRARAGEVSDHRQQERCSATPSARPARSRRSPRSWRSATGCVPPTINLDDPDEAGGGPRPDAARSARRREVRVGAHQLVRLRRPEQRPRLPAVGRMTDERPRRARAAAERPRRRRPAAAADGGRPVAPAASDGRCSASIDRLAALLERSDLTELEVEAGETGLVLRKPAAAAPAAAAAAAPAAGGAGRRRRPRPSADAGRGRARRDRRSRRRSPASSTARRRPGAAPYVQVGRRGRGRPGHRPDRGDEAVQRDQVATWPAGSSGSSPRTARWSRPSSR